MPVNTGFARKVTPLFLLYGVTTNAITTRFVGFVVQYSKNLICLMTPHVVS